MSAAPGIDKAGDQADDLAAWVAQLRHGMSVPNLRRGKGGQLSRLGPELQLVADSLQGRECELRELFDLMS